MHLKSLSISNFRAIENVEIDFPQLTTVIVGPNAVGKSTILEAVRLVKGLLAPRTASEPQQVLMALGAMAPHNPQQLIPTALARQEGKAVVIQCVYVLSDDELNVLDANIERFAHSKVQSEMGFTFGQQAAYIQFVSTEIGKKAVDDAVAFARDAIQDKRLNKTCLLRLTIDKSGPRGEHAFDQACVTFLEQVQAPDQTLFNYYPADRALPIGEIPVQLGSGDLSAQMESYNSQPQSKYSRLKNTIFSTLLQGNDGRAKLEATFDEVFASVLSGRRLSEVGVNAYGLFSIKVEDTDSGRVFDLDAMSSGEKNLILTYLLMSRTSVTGGIILLDEPELHLNPAIAKNLFLLYVDKLARSRNIQMILCSHSPEMLATALDRDDCTLYHLRSANSITEVRTKDQDEASVALRKLGSSQVESLLYRGTVFLEGPSDVDLLSIGFPDEFVRIHLRDLGGRSGIEHEIARLQRAEQDGEEFSAVCFIFDRDIDVTPLKSSSRVKVCQWGRYCIENYLINFDVLTDLLKDRDITPRPLQNIGDVRAKLRSLAHSQIENVAVEAVYRTLKLSDLQFNRKEILDKTARESATLLFSKIRAAQETLSPLDEESWSRMFLTQVGAASDTLMDEWREGWQTLCDGKRLFKDLQADLSIRLSPLKFKRRIIQEMKLRGSLEWEEMRKQFAGLLPDGR